MYSYVAGRPLVRVSHATCVLPITFFFTLTNISHIFPIYLVVIREAHSVNKLWHWCVFDEDCFFVALSTTITIYHVLLSTAWSSQCSVPPLVHIPTYIHTYTQYDFLFSKSKYGLLVIFFCFDFSFDRIFKCEKTSKTLIIKNNYHWELKEERTEYMY